MGIFLNTRDPQGAKHEREKHLKIANERQKSNLENTLELKKIRAVKLQENLERLRDFSYIDDPKGIGVGFGSNFHGNKSYYSVKELQEELDFDQAANDENVGLTDEELRAKLTNEDYYYLFE